MRATIAGRPPDEKRGPGGGRVSETFSNNISAQDSNAVLNSQVRRLRRRFGLPPHLATTIAWLAYGVAR